jgi:iduronate 2-sulfatase
VVTLPQMFRENGYETVGLGKVFHRGLSPDEVKREMDDPKSFDRVAYGKATATGNKGEGRNLTGDKLSWCRWLAAQGTDADQPDGQLADEAVKALAEQRDKPLFLAVGFYRPHDPFIVPKKYFELYNRDKLDLPVTPKDYTPPYPHSLGGGSFKTAFDPFTDKERREFLHAYYAGVSFMDAQVGKLLDALKAHKLADNTVVVFIGDHGYELGARGWWNKNTLFERSCRTPLIVRDPAAKGNGTSTSTITEFVDLYPTLAARCGLKGVPKNLEGADFGKVLDDPTTKHKEAAVTVVQRGQFLGRSLRTDRYRYTDWDGGQKGTELYDHTTDPDELKNLAGDPKATEIKADLKKQLDTVCPARPVK